MRRWTAALLALCACTARPMPAAGQAAGRHTAEFAREMALTRKAGLAVTPSELAVPLPRADRNAAPLYRKAWDLKKRVRPADRSAVADLAGLAVPTREQTRRARAVLAAHGDVLQLYRQAAAKPACVFPRDWSQGAALTFPEYTQFRETARWITADAYLQLADGHPIDAVRTQALGFRVAAQAASDPVIISHLVGTAIDAVTLNGLQRILYAAGSNPAVCAAVRTAIERDRRRLSLARTIGGEVVLGMVSIDHVRQGGVESLKQLAGEAEGVKSLEKRGERRPANWDAIIDANAAYLLRIYRAAYAALGQPYGRATKSLQTLDHQVQRDGQQGNLAAMLATILMPVYDQLPATAARDEARVQVTRAASALLAWKDAHGALPNRLAEAMSPPPLDPFDGKPLRYRRESAGFVVYSVGASGRFDGGRPGVRPNGRESLFRYPMPGYLGAATGRTGNGRQR